MRPEKLTIPQDELLRKLQSGELVVVSRENMEAMRMQMRHPGDILQVATPARETLIAQNFHRINLGSGQRPFDADWRDLWKTPEAVDSLACQICGKSGMQTHDGHRFVGWGHWINVDIQPKWNPDIIADGANLRDHFADGSAEMIVLHHVLEHFGCGEADAMLKECYRVLRPGGSVIVTVPDMESLCKAWLKYKGYRIHVQFWSDVRELDTQVFMTNVFGAYMNDEADRHKWSFDDVSLSSTLNGAGRWKQVLPFDWREIPGADIAQDWWILGMEAVK